MARAEQCVGSASTDFDGRKWPLSATAFPEAIYSILPSCVVYGDEAELQGSPWLYNTAFYLKVSVISRLCIPKVSVKSRLFLWASKREAQLKSGPEGLPCGGMLCGSTGRKYLHKTSSGFLRSINSVSPSALKNTRSQKPLRAAGRTYRRRHHVPRGSCWS
jgi:hypothetical protein